MLHTVFIGIGEDSTELIKQALDDLNETILVDAVILDEETSAHQLFFQKYKLLKIEDLPKLSFDQIILCINESIADDAVSLFRKEFNLTAKQCVAFKRNKIGPHKIDWTTVSSNEDIKAQLTQSGTLNDLETFFYRKEHRIMTKWAHYFEIYDRHFSKYRNKAPVVMEIGIFKGGSLQMWKDYFGKGVQIIGVDIEEDTKAFEEEQITIEIGSQEDRNFLRTLKEKYPKIDILIDDGGHTMNQQITTFEEMFPHLSYGGTYLCEDLHTSYIDTYEGGLKKPNTYIEYSKNFIDYIHAWYSREENFQLNQFSRTMHSLHYYDSVLVIEKEKTAPPVSLF